MGSTLSENSPQKKEEKREAKKGEEKKGKTKKLWYLAGSKSIMKLRKVVVVTCVLKKRRNKTREQRKGKKKRSCRGASPNKSTKVRREGQGKGRKERKQKSCCGTLLGSQSTMKLCARIIVVTCAIRTERIESDWNRIRIEIFSIFPLISISKKRDLILALICGFLVFGFWFFGFFSFFGFG